MNRNYIEISADENIMDFEKQMLSGVNIPSLLPVNIVNQNQKESICFITSGYKPVSQIEIPDIESLILIIKSFVNAIIISEQYLLCGCKHFLDIDLAFYSPEDKETKLVFGRKNDDDCNYGDINVIIKYIENLKSVIINDKVQLQILENIITILNRQNPDIRRVNLIIEEVERKWYCRNMIQKLPFEYNDRSNYQM